MFRRFIPLIAISAVVIVGAIIISVHLWDSKPSGTAQVTQVQETQLASEMVKAETAWQGDVDLRDDDQSASYCVGLDAGRYLIEAKKHYIQVNTDAVIAGIGDGSANNSIFDTTQVYAITKAVEKRMEGDPALLNEVAGDNEACYCMGLETGRRIQAVRKHDIQLTLDPVVLGIKDALAGKQRLTVSDAKFVEYTLQKRIEDAQEQEAEVAASEKNLKLGQAFLENNKTQPGVHITASGLQYLVLQQGTGHSPTLADIVTIKYRTTLVDGELVSTTARMGGSVTFSLNYAFKGWAEALQMMKEGDKWRIFIPPNLAYGNKSPEPEIPANSTLIMDLELVQVSAQ